MTPKEKAEELVGKYFKLLNYEFGDLVYSLRDKQPQQCALIAVDEILNELKPFFVFKDVDGISSLLLEEIFLREHYYKEVKQEIEKL